MFLEPYCSRIFICSLLKVIVILGLSLIFIKKHPKFVVERPFLQGFTNKIHEEV
jgi:hypothetical protein